MLADRSREREPGSRYRGRELFEKGPAGERAAACRDETTASWPTRSTGGIVRFCRWAAVSPIGVRPGAFRSVSPGSARSVPVCRAMIRSWPACAATPGAANQKIEAPLDRPSARDDFSACAETGDFVKALDELKIPPTPARKRKEKHAWGRFGEAIFAEFLPLLFR